MASIQESMCGHMQQLGVSILSVEIPVTLAQALAVVELNQDSLETTTSAPLLTQALTGQLSFTPLHCGPTSKEIALIVEMMTCFSASSFLR